MDDDMALAGIRGVLIARRRKLAREFAPAELDQFIEQFTRVQACIDAVDRAIVDEEKMQPGLGFGMVSLE